MKKKFNTKEKELFKEIAKILLEEWDPIGVNDGDNEWDDEYDSYVPHIIISLAVSFYAGSRIGFWEHRLADSQGELGSVPYHSLSLICPNNLKWSSTK